MDELMKHEAHMYFTLTVAKDQITPKLAYLELGIDFLRLQVPEA